MGLGGALGGLGGAIGGLIGQATAGSGGKDELQQIKDLWDKLQTPNFDMSSLSPPELKMVAELFPQTYDAITSKEAALPEDSATGLGSQQQAEQMYGQMAQGGMPLSERLAQEEAMNRTSQSARNADLSVLSDLAGRGRLGGGTEIAARLQAGQNASNLARGQGADLMSMIDRNRQTGIAGLASVGGQERGQSQAVSGARANAINNFNQYVAQLKTQAARDSAVARAQAQQYNVGTQQNIANQNALNRYGAQESNLNRQNTLRQQGFGNDVTKLGGQTNALTNLAELDEARRAERIKAAQGVGQGIGGTVGGVADIGGFGLG